MSDESKVRMSERDKKLIERVRKDDRAPRAFFDTPLHEITDFLRFGLCRCILHNDPLDLLRAVAVDARMRWVTIKKHSSGNLPIDGNWTLLLQFIFIKDTNSVNEFLRAVVPGGPNPGSQCNRDLYCMVYLLASNRVDLALEFGMQVDCGRFCLWELHFFQSLLALAEQSPDRFSEEVWATAKSERQCRDLPDYAKVLSLFAHWSVELAYFCDLSQIFENSVYERPLPWHRLLFTACREFSTWRDLFPLDSTPIQIVELLELHK